VKDRRAFFQSWLVLVAMAFWISIGVHIRSSSSGQEDWLMWPLEAGLLISLLWQTLIVMRSPNKGLGILLGGGQLLVAIAIYVAGCAIIFPHNCFI